MEDLRALLPELTYEVAEEFSGALPLNGFLNFV